MDAALTSLVAGSGWASGLNVYLVAFALGVTGRLGWLEAVPDPLASTPALVALAVLLLADEIADKVPGLDSVWDAVHTVIRPVGAMVLAWRLTGEVEALERVASSGGAGVLALAAHAAKATARAVINTSPEPVSNWAASLVEDGLVLGLLWLAATNPWLALAVVVVLVVVGVWLTATLVGAARRWWARWRARREGEVV